MMTGNADNRVLVLRCEQYERDAIRGNLADGMAEFGYRPSGKVFVKPNVVFSFKPEMYGEHAWTHRTVVGAALETISGRDGVERVDLGENAAVGMPTRLCFHHAGYYDEVRHVRARTGRQVDIFCIDEEPRDSVFVGGVVHDNLRIPRKMARADCCVYLPKLKCHCVSNMTGAVKLNIGICSDDERSIRHDFLLDEKIVDLLTPGYPDFIVMDAIEIGVGNEALPTPRNLGVILMGRNPVAVDLVAARLLGFGLDDVPYLEAAVRRGYGPASLEAIDIRGDFESIDDLDRRARCIMPHDDEYFRWQDINREMKRLDSPIRLAWGPYLEGGGDRCLTGCVMGLKMFLAFFESYAGPRAFARAKPSVFVVGVQSETIDARGGDVFLIGSCARADIVNAGHVTRIDKCFTTAGDLMQTISHRLGMPSPFLDPSFALPYLGALSTAFLRKCVSMRYLQDILHFITKKLTRRV
ncbi:DUF362 domain-containing protein, partial [Thermodesulfobacteriota bacterium]